MVSGVRMKSVAQKLSRALWDAAHREQINASARARYAARIHVARTWNRIKRYGLTPEAYQAMIDAQGGLCAICRVGWATHIDHDHKTGRVRGVLCQPCNHGLGRFFDQPSIMQAAIEYLA